MNAELVQIVVGALAAVFGWLLRHYTLPAAAKAAAETSDPVVAQLAAIRDKAVVDHQVALVAQALQPKEGAK